MAMALQKKIIRRIAFFGQFGRSQTFDLFDSSKNALNPPLLAQVRYSVGIYLNKKLIHLLVKSKCVTVHI